MMEDATRIDSGKMRACPFCGVEIDSFLNPAVDGQPPRPGDVSYCWECGQAGVFEHDEDGELMVIKVSEYEGYSLEQRQMMVWQMAVFTAERRFSTSIHEVRRLYGERVKEGPGSRYLRFRTKENDRSISHSTWTLNEWPPPTEMVILKRNGLTVGVTSKEAIQEQWEKRPDLVVRFQPMWFVIDKYVSLDGDEVSANDRMAVGAVYVEANVTDEGELVHPGRMG